MGEEKLKREEAEAQQRKIEEKAKADREAAEARRQEQERAEQERAAKAADKEKLDAWLKAKNIKDVTTKKSLGMFSGSAFPLHIAVKEKDPEMVRILLANNADPSAANSSKLTPLQFATKLSERDKTGSYDPVRAALQ